jgi:hypothetical protein
MLETDFCRNLPRELLPDHHQKDHLTEEINGMSEFLD